MRKAFKKLWNDERGNMLVIAGVAMPMLMGAAGLATDTIQWALWKRELQRAADSAAIAGVYDRAKADGDTANTENAVNRDLALNNHTGTNMGLLDTYPKIEFPDDSADGTMRDQVSVTLAVQKRLGFSSMFMDAAPVITASATAATVPGGGSYCVIGLDEDPTASGITIAGSTTLDLGDCSLIANSRNKIKAVDNNGNASWVKAKSLAAAGAVENSNSDRWDVDSYDPYSQAAEDPLETLPVPSSCDVTTTISNKSKDYPIDLSTAAAGHNGKTVCINGSVTVKGALTLGSGTYVINAGDLTMTDTGSSLRCTGCTIILTGDTSAEVGNFRLTGGTLDIEAPTAEGNPYRGVALYQDRIAEVDDGNDQNHVNGNGEVGVQGAIYTPGRPIFYNGGGDLTAVCMLVIGLQVQFSGNSAIKAADDPDCVDLGIPQSNRKRPIRLVA
jgi:hypothetical protein